MADTQTTTTKAVASGSHIQSIGTVKTVVGLVKAVDESGAERVLQAGDKVFANEVIITAADGLVLIEFTDGSHLDLPKSSEVTLNTDVFSPDNAKGAELSAEQIQELIAKGEDPTAVTAATAAGGTSGDEGSSTPIDVAFLNGQGNVTSGYPTVGIGSETFITTHELPPVIEAAAVVAAATPTPTPTPEPTPTPDSIGAFHTNTNSSDQQFMVTVKDGDSVLATGTSGQVQEGQEANTITFDNNFTFDHGQTYAVVIEYLSGPAHINITDFSITDSASNTVVLNAQNVGNDNTTVGSASNVYDGVIYQVQVSNSGQISVLDPIGYSLETDGTTHTLALDSALPGQNDFTLDFSDLPTAGPQDAFGDVNYLNISGSGTHEDNTVSLNAADVLNLAGPNHTIFVTGDVGDAVAVSGSGWTQGADVHVNNVTYSSYTTVVDSVTVTLNVEQDLGKSGLPV